jgi:hypothetical protein
MFGSFLWLANIGLGLLGYLMYKPKRAKDSKPPLMEFKLSAVKIGSPIPVIFGMAKVGGLIIDWGDWTVVAHKQKQSMK